MVKIVFVLSAFLIIACGNNSLVNGKSDRSVATESTNLSDTTKVNNHGYKVIHVIVALCDNKYQGIVPVPASIGNGQNPATNLYWAAAYGVKSWFTKSSEWRLVKTNANPQKNILERLLFRHKSAKVFLVADAYDGQFIKQATIDFLRSASGDNIFPVIVDKDSIYCGGSSDLVAYVGHDGLMDFSLSDHFLSKRQSKRDAIILACYSKEYFSPHLRSTGANPVIWATGLMAPEAYTLHDAIIAWINQKPAKEIKFAAARAYSKYQKCSIKAANNLLTGGW